MPSSLSTKRVKLEPSTPGCICRTYQASLNPPPAPRAAAINPVNEALRIFPTTTLQDSPAGSSRRITEHSVRNQEIDLQGRRFTLYRMYMKEVVHSGGYRKEKDIVLGEWSSSEDMAECSLYNLLRYGASGIPEVFAPLGYYDVGRFTTICSACMKRRD